MSGAGRPARAFCPGTGRTSGSSSVGAVLCDLPLCVEVSEDLDEAVAVVSEDAFPRFSPREVAMALREEPTLEAEE